MVSSRLLRSSPNQAFPSAVSDTYLECGCNLIRTAERLFLHKNTLLYRLNHIKGILRCDLSDADDRLLLMLSFKLLERDGISPAP